MAGERKIQSIIPPIISLKGLKIFINAYISSVSRYNLSFFVHENHHKMIINLQKQPRKCYNNDRLIVYKDYII